MGGAEARALRIRRKRRQDPSSINGKTAQKRLLKMSAPRLGIQTRGQSWVHCAYGYAARRLLT